MNSRDIIKTQGGLVFHTTPSNNSNFYYWLTNRLNSEDSPAGQNGVPTDGYWNTRQRAGYPEDVDARASEEARFPDGQYSVRVLGRDINGNEDTAVVRAIIHNFPPHLVRLKAEDGWTGIYEARWTFDPATATRALERLADEPLNPCFTWTITMGFSEEMARDEFKPGVKFPAMNRSDDFVGDGTWSADGRTYTFVARPVATTLNVPAGTTGGVFVIGSSSAPKDMAGHALDGDPTSVGARDPTTPNGTFLGVEGPSDSHHVFSMEPPPPAPPQIKTWPVAADPAVLLSFSSAVDRGGTPFPNARLDIPAEAGTSVTAVTDMMLIDNSGNRAIFQEFDAGNCAPLTNGRYFIYENVRNVTGGRPCNPSDPYSPLFVRKDAAFAEVEQVSDGDLPNVLGFAVSRSADPNDFDERLDPLEALQIVKDPGGRPPEIRPFYIRDVGNGTPLRSGGETAPLVYNTIDLFADIRDRMMDPPYVTPGDPVEENAPDAWRPGGETRSLAVTASPAAVGAALRRDTEILHGGFHAFRTYNNAAAVRAYDETGVVFLEPPVRYRFDLVDIVDGFQPFPLGAGDERVFPTRQPMWGGIYDRARLNLEAVYPDGPYEFSVRADDCGYCGAAVRREPLIVDNFRPYLHRLVARHNTTRYDAAWPEMATSDEDIGVDSPLNVGSGWLGVTDTIAFEATFSERMTTETPPEALVAYLLFAGGETIQVAGKGGWNPNGRLLLWQTPDSLGAHKIGGETPCGRACLVFGDTAGPADFAGHFLDSDPATIARRIASGAFRDGPDSASGAPPDTNHVFRVDPIPPILDADSREIKGRLPGSDTDDTIVLSLDVAVDSTWLPPIFLLGRVAEPTGICADGQSGLSLIIVRKGNRIETTVVDGNSDTFEIDVTRLASGRPDTVEVIVEDVAGNQSVYPILIPGVGVGFSFGITFLQPPDALEGSAYRDLLGARLSRRSVLVLPMGGLTGVDWTIDNDLVMEGSVEVRPVDDSLESVSIMPATRTISTLMNYEAFPTASFFDTRIAYLDGTTMWDIYVDPPGETVARAAFFEGDRLMAWTMETGIVFNGPDYWPKRPLCIVDVTTKTVTKYLEDAGFGFYFRLHGLPMAETVVFTQILGFPRARHYAFNPKTGEIGLFTPSEAYYLDIAPDGRRWIIGEFSSWSETECVVGFQFYLQDMNGDSRFITQIKLCALMDYNWSADGRWIAFHDFTSGLNSDQQYTEEKRVHIMNPAPPDGDTGIVTTPKYIFESGALLDTVVVDDTAPQGASVTWEADTGFGWFALAGFGTGTPLDSGIKFRATLARDDTWITPEARSVSVSATGAFVRFESNIEVAVTMAAAARSEIPTMGDPAWLVDPKEGYTCYYESAPSSGRVFRSRNRVEEGEIVRALPSSLRSIHLLWARRADQYAPPPGWVGLSYAPANVGEVVVEPDHARKRWRAVDGQVRTDSGVRFEAHAFGLYGLAAASDLEENQPAPKPKPPASEIAIPILTVGQPPTPAIIEPVSPSSEPVIIPIDIPIPDAETTAASPVTSGESASPVTHDIAPPVTTIYVDYTDSTGTVLIPQSLISVAAIDGPTGVASGVSTTLLVVDGETIVTYEEPVTPANLGIGYGAHSLGYLSKDAAGNIEETRTFAFTVSPALDVARRLDHARRVLLWWNTDETSVSEVEAAFAAGAIYLDTVATAAEFVAGMRSGRYNLYVVLGNDRHLSNEEQGELAALVDGGAGLVSSRMDRVMGPPLGADAGGAGVTARDNVLGIKTAGFDLEATAVEVWAGLLSGETVTFSPPGRCDRVRERYDAEILAAFPDEASDTPAITRRQYGAGGALYFDFDLAEALRGPESAAVAGIVGRAMEAVTPTSQVVAPGSVVVLAIDVKSLVVPLDLTVNVEEVFGAGMTVLDVRPAPFSRQPHMLTWYVVLDVGDETSLAYSVEATEGAFEPEATVSYAVRGLYYEFGRFAIGVEATSRSGLAGTASDSLYALASTLSGADAVRVAQAASEIGAIENATFFDQDDAERAIGDVLDAIEAVTRTEDPAGRPVRDLLNTLVSTLGQEWTALSMRP